ncbi:MAG: phage Gp37/Gp68 family protein [Spirulina sp. SIO3F2]|nr:phage Gp37/Gp68 family protein [Spirulina sp. SIO3F2]
MTKIEWTNQTWNPVVGCSKTSPGCAECYAILMAHRLEAMAGNLDNPGRLEYYKGLTQKLPSGRIEWTGEVKFVEEALQIPLQRKKSQTYFVNSMSDLFHDTVTDKELDQIFAVMALTPQHTYQVLTKRPERMHDYCTNAKHQIIEECTRRIVSGSLSQQQKITAISIWADTRPHYPLPNIWLGVTTEDQRTVNERIPLLLQTPAVIRFLSCEPLLEKIDIESIQGALWLYDDEYGTGQRIKANGIDQVIIGGESGPRAKPCHVEWLQDLVAQCRDAGVAVFVKQLGSNVWHQGQRVKLVSDRKGSSSETLERFGLNIREFPGQVEAIAG